MCPGFLDVDDGGGLTADPPFEETQTPEATATMSTAAATNKRRFRCRWRASSMSASASVPPSRRQPLLVEKCHVVPIYDTCSIICISSSGRYPKRRASLTSSRAFVDHGAALRGRRR